MVVGFIFKQQEPVLNITVYRNLDFYGAGIDFFGSSSLSRSPCFFKYLAARVPISLKVTGLVLLSSRASLKIILVGSLNGWIIEFYTVDGGIKSCMSAVIGPVCINHSDFCNGRVTVFTLKANPDRISGPQDPWQDRNLTRKRKVPLHQGH